MGQRVLTDGSLLPARNFMEFWFSTLSLGWVEGCGEILCGCPRKAGERCPPPLAGFLFGLILLYCIMRTQLLPVENWYAVRPDEGYAELIDPSGMPYRPDRPPLFIHDDPILGPALEVTPQEASKMRVTVMCGLQQEAADLGGPGEFEALIDDAQLFGDDTRGLRSPLSDGYTTRMLNVTDKAALAGRLRVFNTIMGTDDDTITYIEKLQGQSNAAAQSIAETEPQGLTDLEMYIAFDVATAHVANALQWTAVAAACNQLRGHGQESPVAGDQHLVLSAHSLWTDIPRKFGTLGIASRLIKADEEHWSEHITDTEPYFRVVLASGKIALR